MSRPSYWRTLRTDSLGRQKLGNVHCTSREEAHSIAHTIKTLHGPGRCVAIVKVTPKCPAFT